MTEELLAIVQAEERAEAIVRAAELRRQRALAEALASQQARVANVEAPVPRAPESKQLQLPFAQLREHARQRKPAAVQRILEAFYAAA